MTAQNPLGKALLIQERSLMGVPDYSQHSLLDTDAAGSGVESIEVAEKTGEEDFEEGQSIALFLAPGILPGLEGYLGIQSRVADRGERLIIRRAWMDEQDSRLAIGLSLGSSAAIEFDWIYSRNPTFYEVLRPEADDPNEVCSFGWFRRSTLPIPGAAIAPDEESSVVLIQVSDEVLEAARRMDLCETLFEALELRFAEELKWRTEQMSDSEIQDTIASVESEFQALQKWRGLTFNVIIDDGFERRVFGKPLLPMLEFPITTQGTSGRQGNSKIGISFNLREIPAGN